MSSFKEMECNNIKFNCILETSERDEKWQGEVQRIINFGSHFELFIVSRSSIMVLVGKTSRGSFASMPDFEAGCHLIDFKNKFWNQEKLCSALGLIDGITVATALHQLSIKYPFFNLE